MSHKLTTEVTGGKISRNRFAADNSSNDPSLLVKLINNQMIIEGKDALAEEFDVSITTIERWIREGVPKEPRDDENSWAFHRGKVAKWRREVHGQEM